MGGGRQRRLAQSRRTADQNRGFHTAGYTGVRDGGDVEAFDTEQHVRGRTSDFPEA